MFGDKTQPLDTEGKRFTKQQHASDLFFSVVEGKLVRKNIGFSDLKELDLSAVTHHFLLFFFISVFFFVNPAACSMSGCLHPSNPPTHHPCRHRCPSEWLPRRSVFCRLESTTASEPDRLHKCDTCAANNCFFFHHGPTEKKQYGGVTRVSAPAHLKMSCTWTRHWAPAVEADATTAVLTGASPSARGPPDATPS